jgi:hypothetical protein
VLGWRDGCFWFIMLSGIEVMGRGSSPEAEVWSG